MITIYSADAAGRLFTDPKQHYYIDAALLQEKATAIKTAAVLDRIARVLGYESFDSLDTTARCCGITPDVLQELILSGKIIDALQHQND